MALTDTETKHDVTSDDVYLLVLLPVQEHIFVRGDHQTHVTQETVTTRINELQNILKKN